MIPELTHTFHIDVLVDGLLERQFIVMDKDRKEILGRVGIAATNLTIANVRQLYVVPYRRNEGIGSWLLSRCVGFATESGCTGMNISLHSKNVALGPAFYYPRGFILAAEYSDGEQCFVKPLYQ